MLLYIAQVANYRSALIIGTVVGRYDNYPAHSGGVKQLVLSSVRRPASSICHKNVLLLGELEPLVISKHKVSDDIRRTLEQ